MTRWSLEERESETSWNFRIAFLKEWACWDEVSSQEGAMMIEVRDSRWTSLSSFLSTKQQQIDNAISNRISRLSDSWKIIGRTTEWSHYLLPGTSHQRTISIHLRYSCSDPNSQHGIESLPLARSVLRLWLNQKSLPTLSQPSSSSFKAFGEYNKSWNISMSQTLTSTQPLSPTSPSFSIANWSRQKGTRSSWTYGRVCW